MFAAKILAPHDSAIAESISTEQARQRSRVTQADTEIRGA
jgi:phosphoribosylcarboxyaminoimidazole (NCAIR) mutase